MERGTHCTSSRISEKWVAVAPGLAAAKPPRAALLGRPLPSLRRARRPGSISTLTGPCCMAITFAETAGDQGGCKAPALDVEE